MTNKDDGNVAMSTDDEPVCIILAAGKSQRFGSEKMSYRMSSGLTLLQETIINYKQVFNNISVVIRQGDGTLKKLLNEYSVTIIESPYSEQGLSQSLVSGVKANFNDKGYLIALGDMPYIKLSSLNALEQTISSSKAGNIVALQMNQRLGNPVWFGANYEKALLNLTGDIGAKRLVKAHAESLIMVDVMDEGIFKDIDTPSDLL